MKLSFLRQVARMLIFSIFLTGLTTDLQAARAKASAKAMAKATDASTPVQAAIDAIAKLTAAISDDKTGAIGIFTTDQANAISAINAASGAAAVSTAVSAGFAKINSDYQTNVVATNSPYAIALAAAIAAQKALNADTSQADAAQKPTILAGLSAEISKASVLFPVSLTALDPSFQTTGSGFTVANSTMGQPYANSIPGQAIVAINNAANSNTPVQIAQNNVLALNSALTSAIASFNAATGSDQATGLAAITTATPATVSGALATGIAKVNSDYSATILASSSYGKALAAVLQSQADLASDTNPADAAQKPLVQAAITKILTAANTAFPAAQTAADPAFKTSGFTVANSAIGAPYANSVPGQVITTLSRAAIGATSGGGTCPNSWKYSASACNSYSTTGQNCNLNDCFTPSSSNTPVFATPSTIVPDQNYTGPSTTMSSSPIMQYDGTIQNLLNAITNYTTMAQRYAMNLTAYSSLLNIYMQNLVVSPCPATGGTCPADGSSACCAATTANGQTSGILPFSAGLVNSIVNPSGDFLPVIGGAGTTPASQKGALMKAFLQFSYATQANCSQSDIQAQQCGGQAFLQAMVAFLLYPTLTNQLTTYGQYANAQPLLSNQVWTVAVDPNTKLPLSPIQYVLAPALTTPAAMVAAMTAQGYVFNGGSPSAPGVPTTNMMNLLTNIAQANWSEVSPTDLYAVINNTDWTGLPSFFVDQQYPVYLLGGLQAINNGQIYFRCDLNFNTGKPISGDLYYAVSPTLASISLADQFAADTAAQGNPSQLGVINGKQTTFLPDSVVTTFKYAKGSFYYWLPATTKPGDVNSSTIAGVVSLSGLNNGVADTLPGSLWASVCTNSSSASMPNTVSQVLDLINTVGSEDVAAPATSNTSPGYPTLAGQTLQGTQQNLLTAAQAAINSEPVISLSTTNNPYSSWIGNTYSKGQATTTDISGNIVPLELTGNNQTVIPTVLLGFDTAFATIDHINMLTDLSQTMSAYESCWANISQCANHQAANAGPTGFNKWMQNPTNSTLFGLGMGMVQMGLFMGGPHIYQGLKSYFENNKMRPLDYTKAPQPAKLETPKRASPFGTNSAGQKDIEFPKGESVSEADYGNIKTAARTAQANANQDLAPNTSEYNSAKANIEARMAAAEAETDAAAEAEGEAEAWNEDFPDDPITIDV